MKTVNIPAMLAHCDELTCTGRELAITWEGGNDNGWLTLLLEGQEIQTPNKIEEEIMRFVEDHLGYGSFAGDFSTDGKIVYDRQNKCFVGQDTYSETDSNLQDCRIDIGIPEHIWFDSLLLSLANDGNEVTADVQLRILNGPHPAGFDAIKEQMEQQILERFVQITDNIEHFAGVWEDFAIPRAGFKSEGGALSYEITSFTYQFYDYDLKDIVIRIE